MMWVDAFFVLFVGPVSDFSHGWKIVFRPRTPGRNGYSWLLVWRYEYVNRKVLNEFLFIKNKIHGHSVYARHAQSRHSSIRLRVSAEGFWVAINPPPQAHRFPSPLSFRRLPALEYVIGRKTKKPNTYVKSSYACPRAHLR